MDIYLIRHADAVPVGERGITEDAERPLSERGQEESEVVARGLQKRGVRLDKLLTSPLVRARETAEIMLKRWHGPAPELIVCDELLPDARPRKLARVLRQITAESVGLVGHLPHISLFAAWLIGSKKAQIEMGKAGVAHITSNDSAGRGTGALEWLVTLGWLKE
jgi:phosphohistidine phosphatase